MKKFTYALLAVAAIGGTVSSAQAVPCWDGIKESCTQRPMDYTDCMVVFSKVGKNGFEYCYPLNNN